MGERIYHTPNLERLLTYSPELHVLDTPEAVDRFTADQLIGQIQRKPNSVLTLPTGATPMGMYGLTIEAASNGLDVSGVTVFNLDEYWPLPEGHPASYARFMDENFFDHVSIPATQRHIPNCHAASPHAEADRYEALLRQRQVDLAILGIGPGDTCHVGFNEKKSGRRSRTRYVELDPQTRDANAQYFPDSSEMPRGAITQGVGNILEATRVVLVAKGQGKARGIQRTIQGPIGPDAPASYLRFHPNVTFIVDREAASLLQ